MSSLRTRIAAALDEDLGPGDVTTEATIAPDTVGTAEIVAKQPLVVSGLAAVQAVFAEVAARFGTFVSVKPQKADGDVAEPGDVIVTLHGNLRAILVGERVALNLFMRMCGVASHVRRWLQDVPPATFRAVDTRKTTPLWRDLEKAAVRHGGGHNHRFGLFDGVLIKDNHIAGAGGVAEAIAAARSEVHHLLRIEVEVTDLEELSEALAAGCDGVLLDNMTDAELAEAVALVRARRPEVFCEASGNMDPGRLVALAQVGLDLISVGGFVHQARWADLSLKVRRTGVHSAVV